MLLSPRAQSPEPSVSPRVSLSSATRSTTGDRWPSRPDPIHIEDVGSRRSETTPFQLAYDVADHDAIYATASTVLAPYDLERQRPRRLVAQEKAVLARYLDDDASSAGTR